MRHHALPRRAFLSALNGFIHFLPVEACLVQCGPQCSRCCVIQRLQRRPQRASLASSVGRNISAVVSGFILLAHAVFAFAQSAGGDLDCPALFDNTSSCPQSAEWNGGLLGINVHASIEFEARGLMAAALGTLEKAACNTSCPMPGEAPALRRASSWINHPMVSPGCQRSLWMKRLSGTWSAWFDFGM